MLFKRVARLLGLDKPSKPVRPIVMLTHKKVGKPTNRPSRPVKPLYVREKPSTVRPTNLPI